MNRLQLGRLKNLKAEERSLFEQIKKYKPKEKDFVVDTVNDYSTGHPKVISIKGLGDENYRKEKEKLYNKYVRSRIAVMKEIDKIESFIDTVEDPEIKTILRMIYIDGRTQEEVAEKLGYSRSGIAMKLKRYFEIENCDTIDIFDVL